uniref:Uncharacterized protein n=1 Tax=Oryza sativa subsp. japonica TaxID=39947 RepID=Q6ZDA3_ORYSJ|nr:hypothetical protein [Oryza sativa Japonica Group]
MTFISPRASGRPSPSSSSTIDRPAGRSPSVCPAAVTVRSVDQSKGEAECRNMNSAIIKRGSARDLKVDGCGDKGFRQVHALSMRGVAPDNVVN